MDLVLINYKLYLVYFFKEMIKVHKVDDPLYKFVQHLFSKYYKFLPISD